MGKHVTKSKETGDIPVMEAGVLTRAQTLALHNLPPPEQNQPNGAELESQQDYLQLRSRRLVKPPVESRLSVATSEGCFSNFRCDSEENNLDRSIRKSTPCSLTRNSDSIATPSSTTRQSDSYANNQSFRNDLEEFFAQVEQQQRELFIEKYNFDIANDMPLTGRYEWECGSLLHVFNVLEQQLQWSLNRAKSKSSLIKYVSSDG